MSTQPNAATTSSAAPEGVIAEPEIVEQQTTVEEPIESAEETPIETEIAETLSEATASGPADERKLPGYVRALKESDPKAFAKAKVEFFDLAARRAVHQTVQAAREEHELVSSMGGSQGIAKLREDGAFFKTAAQQFLKGDAVFVKDLWEEDPIAAELHVPHMLENYKTRNFDGYKTTLAQLWDTEFKNVGFDAGYDYLESAINAGDKVKALEALKSFRDWKNSISDVARKGPSAREKALLADRTKQVEGREKAEKDEFHKSYRTEAVNQVVEDGSKIFDSFFKGRKLDADDRKDLLQDAFRLVNSIIMKDEQFTKDRDAHLAAGDAAAALKLSRARFAREMPEAVKRIARRYGLNAGPAKPNGTQPGAGAQQPGGGTTSQGFIQVNALPNPDDIDRAKSKKEMLHSGRAILKNGRKVSWAHLRAKVA